eukprot:1886175-Pyramimonas_sp.AAC.1
MPHGPRATPAQRAHANIAQSYTAQPLISPEPTSSKTTECGPARTSPVDLGIPGDGGLERGKEWGMREANEISILTSGLI